VKAAASAKCGLAWLSVSSLVGEQHGGER